MLKKWKLIYSLLFTLTLISCSLHSQNKLNIEDLKGTMWHQYEIIENDTLEILSQGDSCSVPLELKFNDNPKNFDFLIFKKTKNLIDIGDYDLRFCTFDPESYKEEEAINSCPDFVAINSNKNHIWYFINQPPIRKKYKLIYYSKNKEIILKGKRTEKGKTLIFRIKD